ncbi:MAG: PAS domain S-box protein, partial [Planctomycetes bacterium]|nr:PAS domain S-box protein [Planctomycetota bacterium]
MHEFDPRIVNQLERQNAALISLSRSEILQGGDLKDILRKVLPVVSETLKVGRVSVWRFEEGRTLIRSVLQYDARSAEFAEGTVLRAADFPGYFRALVSTDLVDADEARKDPRTAEFTTAYLDPHGISSLLDVPVRGADGRWGVLCHEHVGPARRWTGDERGFALAIANLLAASVEQSERKRAELRLRDYMDHAADSMTIMAPDGRLLYANRAWQQIMGFSEAEIAAGLTPRDFVHPSMLKEMEKHFGRLARGEAVNCNDLLLVAKDGREIVIEGGAQPRMSEGKLEYIYVAWRDVTRQKQNERYRSYFADNSGGIYRFEFRKPVPVSLPVEQQIEWVEAQGYLAECNMAVAQIFEVPRPEDLVGLPIISFFETKAEFLRVIERWIRAGYRLESAETRAL